MHDRHPRISIRLTSDCHARLRKLAEARGVNMSRCVRELIAAAAPDAPSPPRPKLSEDRLLDLLRERAEDGNVAAIRILLELERQADPRAAALDALAAMAEGRQS